MPKPIKPRVYAGCDTSVKCCPGCHRWNYNSQRICVGCGFEFYPKRYQSASRKTCPSCKESNLNSAAKCGCGYVFYLKRANGEAGVNRRGTRNGANKLSLDAVRDIKRNCKLYINVSEYALKYSVDRGTVRAILHGELWGWLK